MKAKKITLFPETENIFTADFVQNCVKHVVSMGYYSKMRKSELCIIDSEGKSSCDMGTLVGWRFVNVIEDFIVANGFEGLRSKDRTREEIAKDFTMTSQLANIVAELIQIKEEDETN